MLDWFNITLAILVVTIAGFIMKAIRQTQAEIDKGLGPAPGERRMKKAIEEITQRDIRCPRCGNEAFAMLGTGNRYKCDSCHFEFEGAEHIPPRSGDY
jgi:ribosomal protein S27AE